MMAEQLNKTGVIAGVPVLVFVFSHYFFASTTAHISAMLLAFLTVGLHLIPAPYHVPFMLTMTAGSAIMMTLTHYATGTSPIIFGSRFVTMGNWWRVGFIMCVVEGAGLLVRQAAAWPPGSAPAPAHAVLSGACSAHLSAIRA